MKIQPRASPSPLSHSLSKTQQSAASHLCCRNTQRRSHTDRLGPRSIGESSTTITASHHGKLSSHLPDEPAVEAEILFLAGILGHFVADGSMPLHTSIQYNGWVGPNPNGYTTGHKIHSMFEGDFVHDNVKPADITPLVAVIQPTVLGDVFSDYMSYLGHSHTLVEQTYQLEKASGFVGAGTSDGKAFVDQRLAAGAVELRDMIYTAWVKSADPIPPYRGN